jgi:hypothetical protein
VRRLGVKLMPETTKARQKLHKDRFVQSFNCNGDMCCEKAICCTYVCARICEQVWHTHVRQAELLHQTQPHDSSTSKSTVWESEPVFWACFDGILFLKWAVHWPRHLPRPGRGVAVLLRLVRPACAALACGDDVTTTLAGFNKIDCAGVPVKSMPARRHSTVCGTAWKRCEVQ